MDTGEGPWIREGVETNRTLCQLLEPVYYTCGGAGGHFICKKAIIFIINAEYCVPGNHTTDLYYNGTYVKIPQN